MTENKRFTVKQRQGATIYSIIDYYGELPLSEGMYYKSNAEKLRKWLNTQHELLNTLYNENEQLKQRITTQSVDREQLCKRIDEVRKENEQLKNDCGILVQSNQDYRKENEQLKQFKEKSLHEVYDLNKENEQLKRQLDALIEEYNHEFDKNVDLKDLGLDF